MKPRLVEMIRHAGMEVMGFYRTADGICHLLAGYVANKDYGDKEGYILKAWRENPYDPMLVEETAALGFFISRTALATTAIRSRIQASPDLLKRIGLGHLKRMLDEGITQKEIILGSRSTDAEFQIDDPAGDPLIAQQQLRNEIVRNLALRHANGEKVMQIDSVREPLCATDDWIDRALRLLANDNLLEGLERGYLQLTDKGHLRAEQITPLVPRQEVVQVAVGSKPMHCFVSYAGEDSAVVKDLVAALAVRGIQVWWDKGQITIGDKLSQKIEEGLSLSRYGLVVVSRHFVAKNWPDSELRALHARAMRSGQKVILPVLLGMSHNEFSEKYPMLADIVTASFDGDISKLAEQIAQAIR